MPNSLVAPVLTPERLQAAYTYASYRQLINDLLTENKTTGPQQSDQLTEYTRLNVQRMQRIDKTVRVLPELQAALTNLRQQYIGLVITEGWCGDAAQIVPVLEAAAQASGGKLTTHYLLRDENLDLIDRYLTNGTRSIPKLVVLHADTFTEAAQWGPRPTQAQTLLLELKAKGATHEEYAEKIHAWYAHDKTQATQQELLALVQGLQ
ncbi:thioredoxin family protein [Hymenobacter tibetensis]|uniref:Thioredoxin family protein n=1 Tax=Hymenobacter tibetensis TaxID=497967 RepID=A0ABY4CX27_9BACT|nr:thioredoxin family protein [Hymenobacter tibetensis]UOG74823.1 thioredoxin family protein [Hymenobacter tibetensis]